MSKQLGVKGTDAEYVRGISSRHAMSAEARSVGAHATLPKGHPLAYDTESACAADGCRGGRSPGGLPASNKSVSDRSGPRMNA